MRLNVLHLQKLAVKKEADGAMTKYRKTEPVEVVKFDLAEWLNDKAKYPMVSDRSAMNNAYRLDRERPVITINSTSLGFGETVQVADGDYIIKGVQGEFYPCKPDIFEQTYELAED